MQSKSASQSGFFNLRVLLALALCSVGALLAAISVAPPVQEGRKSTVRLERDMPVPGGKADDLNRMEEEWNNRLTYPTGIFNPEWLRLAAATDALIQRAIPA